MSGSGAEGFSEQERAAMRERAAELRQEVESGGRKNKAATEELDILTKIDEMDEGDRAMASRIHALVAEHAPDLAPRLWYGQPAWARQGKVVCFFRSGHDDKERYSTFGFTPAADLDDAGGLWPTSNAVTALDDAAEEALATLIRRAAG